ncbi:MAG: gluconate 2-dehydrogenase subunit 3 family protein [Deltaproteobacteria bacterium]|nr:gluconate 2-dehydrogenase subunit 3 family protein [Deltaproteobacteria bacterium]
MITTRRTVLAAVVATSVVGATAGVALVAMPTAIRRDLPPLRALDPASASILAAVADVVCPGGDGLPTATEIGVVGRVDALLASMHPGAVADFTSLLGLLESALFGLLLDGRPRPFSACDPAQRAAGLERWRTSRIPERRTGYRALHGLVSGAYWSHPAVFPHTGYPGSPFAVSG